MTSGSVLVHQESGKLELEGHIYFSNVVDLQRQGLLFIHAVTVKTVIVNLKNLVNCDSSGLALLVGWVREAKKENKDIRLLNPPSFLQDMLKLFGLDGVLPILWEN